MVWCSFVRCIMLHIYIYILMIIVIVVPSDGVFTRRHTAECAFCTVSYSVSCFSTMLPWGGEGGRGRNNCFFEWCFLPLSICTGFYSVFRSFALFFLLHHLTLQCFSLFRSFAFSIGFYSFFRLHDVTDATLHIGVGWGGMGQSRSCEVDHVVEASSCCWCYRGGCWRSM